MEPTSDLTGLAHPWLDHRGRLGQCSVSEAPTGWKPPEAQEDRAEAALLYRLLVPRQRLILKDQQRRKSWLALSYREGRQATVHRPNL